MCLVSGWPHSFCIWQFTVESHTDMFCLERYYIGITKFIEWHLCYISLWSLRVHSSERYIRTLSHAGNSTLKMSARKCYHPFYQAGHLLSHISLKGDSYKSFAQYQTICLFSQLHVNITTLPPPLLMMPPPLQPILEIGPYNNNIIWAPGTFLLLCSLLFIWFN